MRRKVVVIGAGFAGLAAAAYAAKLGHEVHVVEKNEQTGGRAGVWQKEGFSFDMGPSWYLMPDAFENYFALFDSTPNKHYTLKRLDPAYRMFFGDKAPLDIPGNKQDVLRLFDSLEQQGGEKLASYLETAQYQYNTAMNQILYHEYNKITDMLTPRIAIEGSKMSIWKSLDQYGKKYFSSDKARKIVQYTTVFLGGSPKNTPAMYSMISHADINLGVWYPLGGLNAVAQAIEKLAKKYGVTFQYNTPVRKIRVENGRAIGVETSRGFIPAEVVVSNADYWHTETSLLDTKHQSYSAKYWTKRVVAPSGLALYLGVKGSLPQLKHHNLFLQNDWTEHFDQIFDNPKWPTHPSYYVCNPSKSQSDLAPPGHENIFVLVPVASGLDDNDAVREAFTDKIISHLEKSIGVSFAQNIVVKRIFSHQDFSSRYNAFQGTALGLAHTLLQTGPLRPKMRSKKVKGLLYAGQYTHPGVGVPMCLISGQLAAEAIENA